MCTVAGYNADDYRLNIKAEDLSFGRHRYFYGRPWDFDDARPIHFGEPPMPVPPPEPECGVAWMGEYVDLLARVPEADREALSKAFDQMQREAGFAARRRFDELKRKLNEKYPRPRNPLLGQPPSTQPSTRLSPRDRAMRDPFIIDPMPAWQPPPGSVPRDFNGVRYWVVPLGMNDQVVRLRAGRFEQSYMTSPKTDAVGPRGTNVHVGPELPGKSAIDRFEKNAGLRP